MVNALRAEMPDLRIVVLSGNPSATARTFGVDSVRRDNLPLIAWHLLSTDLFISGGGGLVQDTTGIATIRYYLGLVLLAQKLGRKTMLYAQGIGPIATAEGKRFTARVAGRVSLITVRDEGSRALLQELGVTGPSIVVTADPVLAMEPAPPEAVAAAMAKEGIPCDGRLVGLSLRTWRTDVDFTGIMRDAAREIMRAHSARVVLFPFQRSQDFKICAQIREALGRDCFLVEGDYGPAVLMGLMGRMDALVGMRLHSLIFCAVEGVPMLGLAYDPKVRNVLGQVGAPFLSLEEMSRDAIVSQVGELLADRERIGSELRRNVGPLRLRAVENARLAVNLITEKG
jgi:polysaccharide pyruvyl transferase CsaB